MNKSQQLYAEPVTAVKISLGGLHWGYRRDPALSKGGLCWFSPVGDNEVIIVIASGRGNLAIRLRRRGQVLFTLGDVGDKRGGAAALEDPPDEEV